MDFVRVGYFIPLKGPLNGHPPSTSYSQELIYATDCTGASWREWKCRNIETVANAFRTRALSFASPAFYRWAPNHLIFSQSGLIYNQSDELGKNNLKVHVLVTIRAYSLNNTFKTQSHNRAVCNINQTMQPGPKNNPNRVDHKDLQSISILLINHKCTVCPIFIVWHVCIPLGITGPQSVVL